MPAETGDHAVAIALVLDLEHHALVGLVGSRNRLGHDAVESGALEATKPVRRDARSRVAGVRWSGGVADGEQRLQLSAASLERLAPQITISLAEQVEEHDGGRDLLGQKLHPRRGRMKAQLQRFEVERVILGDDDFAVEHAARGQLRAQRLEQFGEVAVERLVIAALDQDLVAVAEDQARGTHPISVRRSSLRRAVVRRLAWRASAEPADSRAAARPGVTARRVSRVLLLPRPQRYPRGGGRPYRR